MTYETKIKDTQDAIASEDKKTVPIIWTCAIASGISGTVGFVKLAPQPSPEVFFMAMLYGLMSIVLVGALWGALLRNLTRAETPQAKVIIAIFALVIALPVTIGGTFPFDLATFAGDPAKKLAQEEYQATVQEAVAATQQVERQQKQLHGKLINERDGFSAKAKLETTRGGCKTRCESWNHAAALLESPIASIEAKIQEYKALKARLDERVKAWQSLQLGTRSTDIAFETVRNEIFQIIAEMQAISPRLSAENAAALIGKNIPIPAGMGPRLQADMKLISAEVANVETEILDMGQAFEALEMPVIQVESPMMRVLTRVHLFLPMAMIALALNLIAPALVFAKMGTVADLHALKKKQAEHEALMNNGGFSAGEIVDLSDMGKFGGVTLALEAHVLEASAKRLAMRENIARKYGLGLAAPTLTAEPAPPPSPDYKDDLYEDFMHMEPRGRA